MKIYIAQLPDPHPYLLFIILSINQPISQETPGKSVSSPFHHLETTDKQNIVTKDILTVERYIFVVGKNTSVN